MGFLVLSSLCLVLSWLIPNHYLPWLTVYNDFSAFLALGFLLFFFMQKKKIYLPLSFFFIFFVSLVPLLQFVFGKIFFFGDAFISFLYLMALGWALVVGFNSRVLFDKEAVFFVLAIVFLIGAMISVWICIRQWLMLSSGIWTIDMPPNGRPFANLAQPNNASTLLFLGLAGLYVLYEKRVIGKFVSLILSAFLLLGVALCLSRTAWIDLSFAVFVLFFMGFRFGRKDLLFYACYILATYSFFVIVLPFLSDALGVSIQSLASRTSENVRLLLWKQMFFAIYEGGLWGYGWNQVSVAQMTVITSVPVNAVTEHAHNIVLDILIWNGPILGVIIISILFVWGFLFLKRNFFYRDLYPIFFVSFLVVHGLLEFPLEYAFFLLPLGFVVGASTIEANNKVFVVSAKAVLLPVFMLFVGLLSFIWYEYSRIEADYRLMRFELNRVGELDKKEKGYNAIVVNQLSELIAIVRLDMKKEQKSEIAYKARQIAYRYPYPVTIFKYALALGLKGDLEGACKNFKILGITYGLKYVESGMEDISNILEEKDVNKIKKCLDDEYKLSSLTAF